MQLKVMDKNARGTKVIIATRYVKNLTMNTEKAHAQVTVFTFKKIGYNKNGENSVVIIKHGVESLPGEASVS